jgi:DNA-binding transcriptional ArsR family regulator
MKTTSNQIDELVRVCRALAAEARVRILTHLRAGPLCVCALAARLNMTQSAVSQHLRVLRDAGLVTAARQGFFTHYCLNEPTVHSAIELCHTQLLGHAARGQTRNRDTGTSDGDAKKRARRRCKRAYL